MSTIARKVACASAAWAGYRPRSAAPRLRSHGSSSPDAGAIIGGLASFPITAIAAIGVGLVESFSSFFASSYKEVIVFGLIIPVLIWLSLSGGFHEEE